MLLTHQAAEWFLFEFGNKGFIQIAFIQCAVDGVAGGGCGGLGVGNFVVAMSKRCLESE